MNYSPGKKDNGRIITLLVIISILFLFFASFFLVIYFSISEGAWKVCLTSFFNDFLQSKGIGTFVIILFLFFLIFGYFMGVLFMEGGDLLNWFVKGGLEKETFRDEMRIAIDSPMILSYYIERYNLLFYIKRNIGFSFFFLMFCSLFFCIFLRPRYYFIYIAVGCAVLGFIFAYFARRAYKDFTERIKGALIILEQGQKK